MRVKFKNDYVKTFPRSQITTTIRNDLYEQFQLMGIKTKQPTSKMFDVLLLHMLKDEKSINIFLDELREY